MVRRLPQPFPGVKEITGNGFDIYVECEKPVLDTAFDFMNRVFNTPNECTCFCKHGKKYRVFTSKRNDSFAIVRFDILSNGFYVFGGDDGTCEKSNIPVIHERGCEN